MMADMDLALFLVMNVLIFFSLLDGETLRPRIQSRGTLHSLAFDFSLGSSVC